MEIRMRKFLATAAVLVLLAGSHAFAQPTVILGPGLNSGRTVYHQAGSRTLSADSVYILTGLYFVDSTFSITIPAGTILRGDTAATLIISRGATINATGTSTNPIVFTSLKPIGQRNPGDWGGVIILGNAPTNQVNPLIEGGIIPGSYGGPNATDNSGTFKYVRLEYPGFRFQVNNEVNGLTMGGVGSGTTIEYVQVSYSNDDSFEWFGGTVNAKYLVAFGGTDDEFDTDFGYKGFGQYLFGMKDVKNWDPTGETNGFESDNEGSASYKAPRTQARFSNVTLIGPRRVDSVNVAGYVGNKFQYSAVIRRGTQFSFYNSAILGYPGGYSLRDSITFRAALNDSLQVRTLSLAAFDGTTFPVLHTSGTGGFFTLAAMTSWFTTGSYNNLGGGATRLPSSLGLVDLNNLNNPDPRPTASSELATAGTEFSVPKRWSGNTFFDSTSYRGAFNPAQPMSAQWTAGWTNFNPQYTHYTNAGWNLVSVPLVPASLLVDDLYPSRTLADMFNFTGAAYATFGGTSSLSNGPGYWAYYNAPKVNPIQGSLISGPLTFVATGPRWVMIGCKSAPVSFSSVTVGSGTGTIQAGPFGYQGSGYATVTTLEPGRGYWVFVDGACTITIP
jgi:hypothetical protein